MEDSEDEEEEIIKIHYENYCFKYGMDEKTVLGEHVNGVS